ncbi:hypothetical protein HPB50_003487 [Hyalomma asiaticum]|uniref:Uncharacterized protein n=1 Tax=Hyalomma asiaticum TaxID=266040 RepID=A0ACB7SB34_HYAAI|nr:hypothetical protein HPB50_003487 [Hyalomma asiaticum]
MQLERGAFVIALRETTSSRVCSSRNAGSRDDVNPLGTANCRCQRTSVTSSATGIPDSTPIIREKETKGDDVRSTAEERPPAGRSTEEDELRASGPSCVSVKPQPPGTGTLSADNALSSPSNVWALARHTKWDHQVWSSSTMPESNLQSPARRGIVRFGGATLREFVPLTTLTEKLTHSPMFYTSLGVLVALGCLALAFVLLSSSTRQRRRFQCDSEECRNAHDYLHSVLDAAVNPCHDFYGHVCRHWHTDNADGTTLTEKATRVFVGELHSTLLRLAESSRTEAPLIRFYSACNSFVTTSTLHSNVARQLVQVYRGDADVLQLTDVAVAVRRVIQLSLHRGIYTLFKVNVVWHGSVALHVSRGMTLTEKLADHAQSAALVEFFREALEEISAIRDAGIQKSDVNATVLELLKYDQRVAQWETNMTIAETVKLSQFGTLLHQTDLRLWLEYVNSVIPRNLGINEASPVMCPDLAFVKAAVESLVSNSRIGLIYIFFHIIAEIGRFYYRSKFIHDKPNETDVLCSTASLDVMGSRWLYLYANLTRTLLSTPSRAGRIFSWVRNVSSANLLDSGMDEADERGARTAVEHVTLFAHTSRSSSPSSNGSARMSNGDNYTAGFAVYYASLKALEAKRRLRDPPSLEELVAEETLLAGAATYTRLLNVVVLPPAMRRPPLMYSTRVPLEFDMGTVGVVMAKALFEAGFPSVRSRETWYKLNVKQFVDCVQRSSSFASVVGAVNLTIRQGVELFAWARAVKIAHNVMKSSYSTKSGGTEVPEDVWIAAMRTFFRRFCLLTCNAVSAGNEARLRCLVPLLNMAEFANAFRCRGTKALSVRPCLLLFPLTL